jgi:hypothetical protein
MTTMTSPLTASPYTGASATAAAATPERVFPSLRFLNLPPELRCMVYEELDVVTRRHTLSDSNVRQIIEENAYAEHDLSVTMVRKSLPVAILRVCKQVQNEAASFLVKKLRLLEILVQHFQLSISMKSRLLRCYGRRLESGHGGPKSCMSQIADIDTNMIEASINVYPL